MTHPSVHRVSFFGVRQIALVDMPETAGEFVQVRSTTDFRLFWTDFDLTLIRTDFDLILMQRVGRAVRFNGHAGLPAEKSNVRVRLYCATLPDDAGGDSDDAKGGTKKQSLSADEQQMEALKIGLDKYDKELKSMCAKTQAFTCSCA